MQFIIPINEVVDGGSQTCHVVETGSINPRVNKRKLQTYFLGQGVPRAQLKRVMKAFGFWGKALKGVKTDETTESVTPTP